ncbi:MAG: NAD kinase [Bacteroidales bacterium]|nr:NAD kinase [Bacteroidales bacterium]
MKRIAIFGKTVGKKNLMYMQQIVDKLGAFRCELFIYKPFHTLITDEKINIPAEVSCFSTSKEIIGKVDFLFSIGGDGTLLDATTFVHDSGIPILGINLGRLGFLSSIPKDKIDFAIENLIQNNYVLDQRSLLRLETKEGLFGEVNYALNELSIVRHDPFSMLTIRVNVNGEYLNSYWADGLLVSTPTGSTAYSLSCGGPIITPDSKNFVISPIASHNLTVRPIVIPDDSEITIQVEGRNREFLVALDSRSVHVSEQAVLTIKKEDFYIHLVRFPDQDFFATMREKLHWGFDKRN